MIGQSARWLVDEILATKVSQALGYIELLSLDRLRTKKLDLMKLPLIPNENEKFLIFCCE